MDDKAYDDWLKSGHFCDSCGTVKNTLYTLQVNCPITLCEECIRKFYSSLHEKKKNGIIIKFFKD